MSLSTFSTFYYGFTVDADNYQLDFDEGGGELTAELNFGDYTMTEFIEEVKRAMDEAGGQAYTVSVNRSTRLVTISASSNFELLTSTGSHGNSTFSLLGFSGSDKTGSNSYTSGSATGSAYEPQYKLQSYVPPGNYKKRRNVTVHETANGLVESISFGDLEMIEMDIRFATDIPQPTLGPIKNDADGVASLNAFMRALITKAPVEFMPDINTPATYHKVILDSTIEDSKGTGYKLKERIDLGIPGYYDTEKLTFRVIEE